MKLKATCEDIENIVKILKEHELKPDKDGFITIVCPIYRPQKLYWDYFNGYYRE